MAHHRGTIFYEARHPIVTMDLSLRCTGFNRAAADSVGVHPESIVGAIIPDAFPFLRKNGGAKRLEKAAAGGTSRTREYFAHPATGHYAIEHVMRRPLRNEQAAVVGVVVTVEHYDEVAPFDADRYVEGAEL